MNAPPVDPLPRLAERVVLRRLTTADLESFQAYRHDPEVGLYQGWEPTSDADAARFLSEMGGAPLFQPGRWIQLGIAARTTDRLIGDIGLRVADDGREAELGFSMARECQGQGLAREAVLAALELLFKMTAVSRVIGITDARNLASIRLLERIGMRRERTVPATFRGEPCLEHEYVLVRPSAD